MKRWLLLAGAILTETSASLSLKGALEQPALYAVVVTGFAASFAFLAAVLRTGMALGVAYGVWGATSVALTAAMSAALFAEPLTAVMLVGIVLIVGGVLVVEVGSQRSARGTEDRTPPARAGRAAP